LIVKTKPTIVRNKDDNKPGRKEVIFGLECQGEKRRSLFDMEGYKAEEAVDGDK